MVVHPPTRRQLSHFQKQKRRQRITLGIGLAVVLAVLGLVSFGLYKYEYLGNYKPMHETVRRSERSQIQHGLLH